MFRVGFAKNRKPGIESVSGVLRRGSEGARADMESESAGDDSWAGDLHFGSS